jgi:hypothetical protein
MIGVMVVIASMVTKAQPQEICLSMVTMLPMETNIPMEMMASMIIHDFYGNDVIYIN